MAKSEEKEIPNYDSLFKNLLSKESNYEFFLKAQSLLKKELKKNPNSFNYISLLIYCINHLKQSEDKQSINSLLDYSLEQYIMKNKTFTYKTYKGCSFYVTTYQSNEESMAIIIYDRNGEVLAQSVNSYTVIAYLDKKTNESMPLCSKINCSHSLEDVDENCDAYIDGEVILGSLFYYDDFLYYINRSSTNYMCSLCRISSDGSEHELICDLVETSDNSNDYFSYVIYEDYVYCSTSIINIDNNNTAIIEKINLDDKSKETIYSYTAKETQIEELSFFDNKLVFRLSENNELLTSDLYCYDLGKKECKKIENNVCSYIYVDNNLIYWVCNDGIYQSSFDKEKEKIYEASDNTRLGSLVYNGQNIYVLNLYDNTTENIFIARLENGKLVDEFYCFNDGMYIPIYLGSDRILVETYTSEGEYYAFLLLDEEGKIKEVVRTDIMG